MMIHKENGPESIRAFFSSSDGYLCTGAVLALLLHLPIVLWITRPELGSGVTSSRPTPELQVISLADAQGLRLSQTEHAAAYLKPELPASALQHNVQASEVVNKSQTPVDQRTLYLPRAELDTPLLLERDVTLPLPPDGVSGSAVVVLYLNELGEVDFIDEVSSSVPLEVLTNSLQSLRYLKYSVPVSQGHPAKAKVKIELSFEGGAASEPESLQGQDTLFE
ncbi:hypothetical protein ACTSKR_01205 [Chitinibacteraceae bacterium HSL-7]